MHRQTKQQLIYMNELNRWNDDEEKKYFGLLHLHVFWHDNLIQLLIEVLVFYISTHFYLPGECQCATVNEVSFLVFVLWSSDGEWCSKWEVWMYLTYYVAQPHVQMTHWTVILLVVFYYWLIWLVSIMISESISLSFGQTTQNFISLRRQFLVLG